MTDDTAAKILQGQATITAEVSGLKAEVSGLSTIMEVQVQHMGNATDELHAAHKEIFHRLGKVERDYLPRKTLDRHASEQREDFGRLAGQVDGIKVAVTRVMAAGAVVLVLAQLAMKWAEQ